MRKSVTIVIPVWKEELTEFEKISFVQCCSILKKYTFHLVSYRGLSLKNYIEILEKESINFKIVLFKKSSFSSVNTYSRLMLSVSFYSIFLKFKYILLYQLDCFVFRDELEFWVDSGYSYIGAPWLKGYNLAKYGDPLIGVGNGGLSLRNVGAHLRVLLSFSYIKKPKMLIANLGPFGSVKFPANLLFLLRNLTIQNNTLFLFNNWTSNEDIFWAEVAKYNYSWFKIPKYKVAAQFSVEVQPRYFFDLNNQRIPFSCHAWWTYDLDFWKPYIEKFGYSLPCQEDGENE